MFHGVSTHGAELHDTDDSHYGMNDPPGDGEASGGDSFDGGDDAATFSDGMSDDERAAVELVRDAEDADYTLTECHTFESFLGTHMHGVLINRHAWMMKSCHGGCCHRVWRRACERAHRQRRAEKWLLERVMFASHVARALLFPQLSCPTAAAFLVAAAFALLAAFAILAAQNSATSVVAFAPLWGFFALLYPVLYIFFSVSSIEPLVLSVLSCVGATLSAVLIFFYRVNTSLTAMSWLSSTTPLLLCLSCCATYAFLVCHRFVQHIQRSRAVKVLSVLTCLLPCLLLVFVALLATELDGDGLAVMPPRHHDRGARSVAGSDEHVPLDAAHCGSRLRLSSAVVFAVMGILAADVGFLIHVFTARLLARRLPQVLGVLVGYLVFFALASVAALLSLCSEVLCLRPAHVFAWGFLAAAALCATAAASIVTAARVYARYDHDMGQLHADVHGWNVRDARLWDMTLRCPDAEMALERGQMLSVIFPSVDASIFEPVDA
jgi:hypothetical protein